MVVCLVPRLRAPGVVCGVTEPSQDTTCRDEIVLSREEVHVAHRPEGRVPIHDTAERTPLEQGDRDPRFAERRADPGELGHPVSVARRVPLVDLVEPGAEHVRRPGGHAPESGEQKGPQPVPHGTIDEAWPVEAGVEEALNGVGIRPVSRTGQQKAPLGREALASHARHPERQPSARADERIGPRAQPAPRDAATRERRRRRPRVAGQARTAKPITHSDSTPGSRRVVRAPPPCRCSRTGWAGLPDAVQ